MPATFDALIIGTGQAGPSLAARLSGAGLKGATAYRGHARFVARDEVRVASENLRAQRIFLNVGGRPFIPSWPGLQTVPHLTNVTMMDLNFVPQHLLVIGGSYVGLEFAQMFRRFGSRVTV